MRTKLRIITQYKLDWIVKLKTNKFFIKWPMKKIKNKKNKDKILKYNIFIFELNSK